MPVGYVRGSDGRLVRTEQPTLSDRVRAENAATRSAARAPIGKRSLYRDIGVTSGAGDQAGQRKTRDRHGKQTKQQRSRERIREEVLTGVPTAEGTVNVTSSTLTPKWYEICRKLSYGILTQQGMYEVPPAWDDTESSPTWDNGLPDPSEPWFKVERPHEIWYMDENLQRHIETFYVATGLSDPVVTSITLVVLPALVNTDVSPLSRITSGILSSPEAAAAIAQAQSEV